jgi:uncharacterized protein
MKTVFDTNLWISALISKKLRERLYFLMLNEEIDFIFSLELLAEIKEVAFRPKFQKYISAEEVSKFLTIITDHAEIISVYSEIKICRDPKDDYLLAICKDSRADYLITGDSDLLVIGEFEMTKILTLTEFEQVFQN